MLSRDLRKYKPFARSRHPNILASILLLLVTCCPSDVSRLVIPVHIDAVDGVSAAWTSTDVRHEGGEVMQPFVGHRNAPTAVIGIRLTEWVVAPLLCATPRTILWRLRPASSKPVAGVHHGGPVYFKATTTSRMASGQFSRGNLNDGAARTSTDPCSQPSIDVLTAFDCSQAPELFTSLIVKMHSEIIHPLVT